MKQTAAQVRSALQQATRTTRWLITFNDLMTLLLTFFVLLISMSTLDLKKIRDLQEALFSGAGIVGSENLHENALRARPIKSPGGGETVRIISDAPETSHQAAPADTPAEGGQLEIPEYLRALQSEGTRRQMEELAISRFRDIVNDYTEMPGLAVRQTRRGIVLQLTENILFDPGEALLKPVAYPIVDRVAEVLKKTTWRVNIEGHTDSTPVRTARYPTNWELAVERATALLEHLATRCSVPADRMGVSAYADWRPVADNDSEANRRKNRRVDIVLQTTGPTTMNSYEG